MAPPARTNSGMPCSSGSIAAHRAARIQNVRVSAATAKEQARNQPQQQRQGEEQEHQLPLDRAARWQSGCEVGNATFAGAEARLRECAASGSLLRSEWPARRSRRRRRTGSSSRRVLGIRASHAAGNRFDGRTRCRPAPRTAYTPSPMAPSGGSCRPLADGGYSVSSTSAIEPVGHERKPHHGGVDDLLADRARARREPAQ